MRRLPCEHGTPRRFGSLVFAVRGVREAEVGEDARMIPHAPQRLAVELDRFVQALLLAQQVGEVKTRVRVRGIAADRAPQRRFRAGGIATAQRRAEKRPGGGVGVVLPERPPAERFGGLVIAALQRFARRAGQRVDCQRLRSPAAPAFAPSALCIRYARRFASRRPRATLLRIKPQPSERKASSMRPVARIAVGTRGTSRVSMYSTITLPPSSRPAVAITSAMPPKNASGFSSRNSITVIHRMRAPSANVDSLLAEPTGRSKYGVVTSAVGSRCSSAWIASSVSISNPREIAGNDFAKRRESTR